MEGKIINSYKLYADAEKCFYKFWLKGSLIEMARVRYSKNILKWYIKEQKKEMSQEINSGKEKSKSK